MIRRLGSEAVLGTEGRALRVLMAGDLGLAERVPPFWLGNQNVNNVGLLDGEVGG